jgi:hypothetical protein
MMTNSARRAPAAFKSLENCNHVARSDAERIEHARDFARRGSAVDFFQSFARIFDREIVLCFSTIGLAWPNCIRLADDGSLGNFNREIAVRNRGR